MLLRFHHQLALTSQILRNGQFKFFSKHLSQSHFCQIQMSVTSQYENNLITRMTRMPKLTGMTRKPGMT